MSLDRFRGYLSQLPEVKHPDCEWSIRWIKRFFEFNKKPFDSDLTFDTNQLITFLVAMKKNGVKAWQRHQAAVTAGRYQTMLCGTIEPGIHEVIRKLADLAKSERNGDAAAAARETHFPKDEPAIVTETRKTLRRRRYKFDTEKAYIGWIQRFLNDNPRREVESLGEPEIRKFLNDLVMQPSGGVAAQTLKQAKSALLFLAVAKCFCPTRLLRSILTSRENLAGSGCFLRRVFVKTHAQAKIGAIMLARTF